MLVQRYKAPALTCDPTKPLLPSTSPHWASVVTVVPSLKQLDVASRY